MGVAFGNTFDAVALQACAGEEGGGRGREGEAQGRGNGRQKLAAPSLTCHPIVKLAVPARSTQAFISK